MDYSQFGKLSRDAINISLMSVLNKLDKVSGLTPNLFVLYDQPYDRIKD